MGILKTIFGTGMTQKEMMKLAMQEDIARATARELKKPTTCIDCGKILGKGFKCSKNFWRSGIHYVCDECVKKCKKCKKSFCSKHFRKHYH